MVKKDSALLEFVKTMSVSEQKDLVEKILTTLNDSAAAEACSDMISTQSRERPNGPHCHANAESGYTRALKQDKRPSKTTIIRASNPNCYV